MPINLGDGFSDELNTPIRLKIKWVIWIILISLIAGAFTYAYIAKTGRSDGDKIIQKITKDYKVRRYFDGRIWGTFWDYCGVTFTADHVVAGLPDDGVGFVKKPAHRSLGLIDATWYGKKWKCETVTNPENGMPVYMIGYPSGSDRPSLRQGRVHTRRNSSGSEGYQISTWIIVFDGKEVASEPVVGGMSGGIVTDMAFNPVGILVTQNSPADFNGDNVYEHSADVVGLKDTYDAFIELANTTK